MSDAAENIFGVVASALGVIGIIPLVWVVIKCQLPVAKVKALEDILSDTKDFLLFVVEEGHMNDETFAYEVGRELDGYVLWRSHDELDPNDVISYQERADELKIEAYRDDGYLSQLKGMVSGLSCRIYAIYRKVRKIRSKISVGARIVPLWSLPDVCDLVAQGLRKQEDTQDRDQKHPARPPSSIHWRRRRRRGEAR